MIINLDGIKTRFVRDRLKEIPWDRRAYINALIRIEEYVEHPPTSFAAGMQFHGLRKDHPVEHICIKREINEDIYTTADEYQAMKLHHERETQQRDSERRNRDLLQKANRHQQEATLRVQWHRLGGIIS